MGINNFIGIDLGADNHACTALKKPDEIIGTLDEFPNTPDGFNTLHKWLMKNGVSVKDSVVCVEATGVYGEALCYFLYSKGFRVAVEHPLKVKRAFKVDGPKTDPVDSRQIAEYAFRYLDALNDWHPRAEVVEQISVLLSTREHLTIQKTASTNALKAVKRKHVQTPQANAIFEEHLNQVKKHIDSVDKEIKELISKHPTFHKYVSLLISIPGVAMLLASNILVLTDGFSKPITAAQICAYMRICPYPYTSGKSVHRRPKAFRHGPSKLRKLTYLAALSIRTHNEQFKHYFLRKVAEGKSKRLVINNIANKLVKVICSVMENEQPFIANYKSINPVLLKNG